MDLFAETETVLTAEQAETYKLFMRQYGIDADARLNGQRLTVTPFHTAQLMVIMSMATATELAMGSEAMFMMDDLMGKVTDALHEVDLADDTVKFVDMIGEEEQFQMAQDQELRGPLVPEYPK